MRTKRTNDSRASQTAEAPALLTDAVLEQSLRTDGVAVLPPADVAHTLDRYRERGTRFPMTMLDPWYNKGVGGTRDDYDDYILGLIERAAAVSDHVFFWGFPEIVAPFVARLPASVRLVAWLTWYYKNSPSVIRGWRSSQMACLHLARPDAPLYPEHFLNEAQKKLQSEGKLRYMPGPTSVIEESLLCGFVGRSEQTGHPAQKPVRVFEPLILMTTKPGDIVLDPMCGAGTTAAAAMRLGRRAVLADLSPEYLELAKHRLRGVDASAEVPREEGLFSAMTAPPSSIVRPRRSKREPV
jgi:hypothetical protein